MQERPPCRKLGLSLNSTVCEVDSALAASLSLSLVCLTRILVMAFTGKGRLQEWERIIEIAVWIYQRTFSPEPIGIN